LLFAVTNIARHLRSNQSSFEATNRKFRRRFGYIEKQLRERDQTFDTTTLTRWKRFGRKLKKANSKRQTAISYLTVTSFVIAEKLSK